MHQSTNSLLTHETNLDIQHCRTSSTSSCTFPIVTYNSPHKNLKLGAKERIDAIVTKNAGFHASPSCNFMPRTNQQPWNGQLLGSSEFLPESMLVFVLKPSCNYWYDNNTQMTIQLHLKARNKAVIRVVVAN